MNRSPVLTAVPYGGGRVTVAEAARRLGVSNEAIRQRIRRGTLQSYKVDGHVYVQLDTIQTETGTPAHTVTHTTTVTTDASDGPYVPYADQPPALPETFRQAVDHLAAAYQQTIEHLSAEVAFLRDELRRKDELLAHATAPAPPLPDFTPAPITPLPPQPKPRRRWWRW